MSSVLLSENVSSVQYREFSDDQRQVIIKEIKRRDRYFQETTSWRAK